MGVAGEKRGVAREGKWAWQGRRGVKIMIEIEARAINWAYYTVSLGNSHMANTCTNMYLAWNSLVQRE